MFKRKSLIIVTAAALAGSALSVYAPPHAAHAQSTMDMSVLSEQQRADFTKRLQNATSSADRARITSEINRAVQQRKLELRRQERESQPPQGQ